VSLWFLFTAEAPRQSKRGFRIQESVY